MSFFNFMLILFCMSFFTVFLIFLALFIVYILYKNIYTFYKLIHIFYKTIYTLYKLIYTYTQILPTKHLHIHSSHLDLVRILVNDLVYKYHLQIILFSNLESSLSIDLLSLSSKIDNQDSIT